MSENFQKQCSSLPTELKQLVISFLGNKKLYMDLWGTIPPSMEKILIREHEKNILAGSEYILCCEDIIFMGDLKPGIENLFVSCFKSASFENALYIYLCLFSRISQKERIEILNKITLEIENLKNYVLYEMKLTMCKKFSDYYNHRYEMIFQNEQDLIKTILVVEMYKVMENYYFGFKRLFEEKIVERKWIHLEFPLEFRFVKIRNVKLIDCMNWDIPIIYKTDHVHPMIKNICERFEKSCFDSCFYCRFYKIFCIHFFRLKDMHLYRLFDDKALVKL